MSPQFKKLYCQYIEKGITSFDIGKFRNELNNIPDEELWNTMIDMENDTVEIKMPPMMKKQIRKELQQIIWRRRWLQYMKYAASVKELPLVSSYTKLAKDTQEFSEVMEIEDGVEQAFSVSSELLIKLMEQVEGITYGKNGLEVQSNGRIKVRDCFAKKICTDVPTLSLIHI